MFVFIFLADLNFIMAYIISLFVIIIVYQNPLVYRIVNEFLNNNVFDTVNPTYEEQRIFSVDEHDMLKQAQSLDKIIKIEKNEIKIDDDEEDQKDTESLYQKLRTIKKTFFIVQVYIQWLSSGSEKIKNLFTWQEYRRTMSFLILLVISYCLIKALPIRYMMLAGIINEWFDGKSVYKRRQQHNEKIATSLLEYLFKRYLPDAVKQADYLLRDWPNNVDFKRKIVEETRLHLELQFQIVSYRTPMELINAISTFSDKLKLKRIIDNTFVRDQLYYELRQNCKFKLKPHHLIMYTFSNFLYNIPSDYYRLRNPRKLEND